VDMTKYGKTMIVNFQRNLKVSENFHGQINCSQVLDTTSKKLEFEKSKNISYFCYERNVPM